MPHHLGFEIDALRRIWYHARVNDSQTPAHDAAAYALTTAQAAAHLAISCSRLRGMVRSGDIPATTTRGVRGPEHRFRLADLEALLARRQARLAANSGPRAGSATKQSRFGAAGEPKLPLAAIERALAPIIAAQQRIAAAVERLPAEYADLRLANQRLERQLAEQTRDLSTLLDVSSHIASTLELRPLLRRILDNLMAVIDHSGSSIQIVEGDWLVMLEHRFPPGNAPRPEWLRVPLSTSHFWPTVLTNEPYLIDDLHADSPAAVAYRALFGDRWETIRPHARSYIAVPLSHRDRVLGALIVGHHEAGYFTPRRVALVRAIANQAAMAIENAQLFERVRDAAVIEERQRLSRELHDSVSQALYSIALGARTARALLARDPAQAAESLDFVLQQAEVALAEMRTLIFELRPETLERDGLVTALQRQADALTTRHHLNVETSQCPEPIAPLHVKDALYRVAQETLHNAVKHAQANHIQLTLAALELELVLRITDNGRGFDPAASYPGHLGLQSMRERLARVGGTLRIDSAPNAGTRVYAHVPHLPEAMP